MQSIKDLLNTFCYHTASYQHTFTTQSVLVGFLLTVCTTKNIRLLWQHLILRFCVILRAIVSFMHAVWSVWLHVTPFTLSERQRNTTLHRQSLCQALTSLFISNARWCNWKCGSCYTCQPLLQLFLIVFVCWCSCILSHHYENSQSVSYLAEPLAYCEAVLQAKIEKAVVFMKFAPTGLLLKWSKANWLLVN